MGGVIICNTTRASISTVKCPPTLKAATGVGELFAHVRKRLPWADPKLVKQLIDTNLYALLGERTAADNEKPVKRKKEKPAKVEEKCADDSTPLPKYATQELNPYSVFPSPEENFKSKIKENNHLEEILI